MATDKAIAWVERMVWTLIYGGLFTAVIGLASLNRDPVSAWALMIIGVVLAVTGAVLVYVRSRMQADPAPQSPGKPK
jgi:hypothetical protein